MRTCLLDIGVALDERRKGSVSTEPFFLIEAILADRGPVDGANDTLSVPRWMGKERG